MSGISDFFDTLGYVLIFQALAPLFPLLYVVLHWRSGGQRIVGAGTYAGVLYFATASVLLAIAGAANLTYGIFSTTPIEEATRRLSWGLFVGGIVFLGLNLRMASALHPADEMVDARRIFGGFLMIVTGMISLAAIVMFLMTVFGREVTVEAAGDSWNIFGTDQKGADYGTKRADDLKLYACWTIYFLTTYLYTARTLARGALAMNRR